MKILALFRILKALVILVRELWFRERTFRQFIHDNMAVLVVTVGFVVIFIMFLKTYLIVQEQNLELAGLKSTEKMLRREIEYLEEKLADRSSIRMTTPDTPLPRLQAAEPPEDPKPKPEKPAPKKPTKPIPVINRPTNVELQERWRRLSE